MGANPFPVIARGLPDRRWADLNHWTVLDGAT